MKRVAYYTTKYTFIAVMSLYVSVACSSLDTDETKLKRETSRLLEQYCDAHPGRKGELTSDDGDSLAFNCE